MSRTRATRALAARQYATARPSSSFLSNLLASYSWNSGSGTSIVDDTGNHTATLHGTTAGFWGSGPFAGAGSGIFDGTDNYVSIPQSSALDFERTQQFTIAAWIKPANITDVFHTIYSTLAGASNTGYEFGCFNGTNASGISCSLANTVSGNNYVLVCSGAILVASAWQHVAVVYTGTSTAAGVTLYRNGAPVAVTVVKDALTASIQNSQAPAIGVRPAAGSFYMNGAIGSLQIWGRALSSAEISAHYNAGLGRAYPFALPARTAV